MRHHAEAEEADAAVLGALDRHAQPFLPRLRRLVVRHLAMQAQDVHHHILGHHGIAARRLDLAERHLRQLRMTDDVVDASRAAEHGFKTGKWRQRVEVGMHEGEILDPSGVARLRPEADLEIGKKLD